MSDLTDKLGFYFLVFQRASINSTFLKCYIDGDTKPVFYTDQELLDFCNQVGYDGQTEAKLKNCLDTTSIYLWDIEERTIKRLSPNYNFENSKLESLKNAKLGKKENNIIENPYINCTENGEIKLQL